MKKFKLLPALLLSFCISAVLSFSAYDASAQSELKVMEPCCSTWQQYDCHNGECYGCGDGDSYSCSYKDDC